MEDGEVGDREERKEEEGKRSKGQRRARELTNMYLVVVEAKILRIMFPVDVLPDMVLHSSPQFGRRSSSYGKGNCVRKERRQTTQ